jgi:DNA-binding LacI/PurR family transcriptional regulator
VWAREEGGYTYAGGLMAAQKLLSAKAPPDAIFCANDVMALAAVDAATSMAIKIPDQLSVIGFDNIPLAGFAHYALTTVDQNVNLMATEAVRMLLAAIKGHLDPPQTRTIPCALILRSSVRNTTG